MTENYNEEIHYTPYNAPDGMELDGHIKETQEDGIIIMRLPPETVVNSENIRLYLTNGILWEGEISQEEADKIATDLAKEEALKALPTQEEYLLDLDFRLTCLEFGLN